MLGASLGPPRGTGVGSKRRVAFSILYTAAVTVPFLVTGLYWLVLFQPNPGVGTVGGVNVEVGTFTSSMLSFAPLLVRFDKLCTVQALHYFVLINVYGFNSIIALVEIMVLSSARKQKVMCLSTLFAPL